MSRILYPLATSLLFSGSYVAGKYTTEDLGPLTTTLLRYAVALAFLLVLGLYHGRAGFRVRRQDLGGLLLLGLTGVVGYHYFFFLSLRYTEVANTAIINALSPVVTGLAAAAFIGERLSARNMLGVVLACAGVMILLSDGKLNLLAGIGMNKGDLFMLLAVGCWTIYTLMVKRLVACYSGFTLTFYATAFGLAVLIPIVPLEDPASQLAGISTTSAVSILYMGIAGSGFGYLLYTLSIRELGPTRTTSFVYSMVALFVAVAASVFFDEPITAIMAASALLVLVSLQLMLARRQPGTPLPRPGGRERAPDRSE